MISSIEAYKILRKEHPEVNIICAADYNDSNYVFCAESKKNRADADELFFGVNKVSGVVTFFTPTDYEAFFDALDNRAIALPRI